MHSAIKVAGAALLLIGSAFGLRAETAKNPPDARFTDHGAPAPVSLARGAAATLDGDGRRVLLVWQTDIGKLLSIDVETGAARQFAMPDFPPGGGSFGVLQSRRGLWYTHAGPWAKPGRLYEFDPKTMTFTFSFETKGTYAMAFHEDRDGVIWLALYPDAQLISYDPATRKVVDHGSLNSEKWPQYPRVGLARDAAGWIYTVIGFTRCQILGYNPATGERKAYIPESERGQAKNDAVSMGQVFLGEDGKAYARTVTTSGMKWYQLSGGEATALAQAPTVKPVPERAHGCWGQFPDFPDGSNVTKLDVPYKRLTVRDADGTERRLTFDYDAPGALMMNVFTGPGGEIYGSTAYPRFVFRFDPATGTYFLHPDTNAGGHWNSWVTRGDKLYGAFYPWGMIREIDTSRPWARGASADFEPADYGKSVKGDPHIHRPNVLLAHPDGIHLVMGGTPDYGHTGGGLLIWNLETNRTELLTHEQLIKHQNTVALAALPDGNLVGATSVSPGTGGERLASVPEIYIFDWKERKILWHQPLPEIKGNEFTSFDLLTGPDGLVYLLDGGSSALRVFDPARREMVRTIALGQYGKPAGSAGNGVMIRGDAGEFYLLFDKSLVKFDPVTGSHEKLADLPVTPRGSLALHDGRLYFASGSHLWSFRLQP
jgi:hypothetical protein